MLKSKILATKTNTIRYIRRDYFIHNLEDFKTLILRVPHAVEGDLRLLLEHPEGSTLWQYSYGLFTRNGHLAAIMLAREQYNCFGFAGRSIFIEYISVKEKYDKRRYAVQLFYNLFGKVIEAGLQKIFLTVDLNNIKAYRRYQKMGFRTIKNYKSNPEEMRIKGTENARVMLKEIRMTRAGLDRILPY